MSDTILRILERTPQWIRHDLLAADVAVRQRAEETLAIMIATALEGDAASQERA